MNKKVVEIRVVDENIYGAGVSIGAVGSHGDTVIEAQFSETWKGKGKIVAWTNAVGEQTVITTIRPELLVEGTDNTYRFEVPSEVTTYAGVVSISIKGTVVDSESGIELTAITTEEAFFRVRNSVGGVLESDDISASNAERILSELERSATIFKTAIKSFQINDNGELEITYAAGEPIALGKVKGADGKDGKDGVDGSSPYIKNGVWWIGDVNTGVKVTGKGGIDSIDIVDGVLVVHYTDGEAVPAGEAIGPQGPQGIPGENGKDGENGADGENGYSPVMGIDYWTEADKEAINADNVSFISAELAKRAQLKPEFANDKSECTDTSRLYVLPDGKIYANMYVEEYIEPYNNLFNSQEDGYLYGYYFNSSNAEAEKSNSIITNYIEIESGKTLHIKGFATKINGGSSSSYARMLVYDENKARLATIQIPDTYSDVILPSDYDAGVITYHMFVNNSNTQLTYSGGTPKYIRIGGTLSGSVDDVVVTVNENIEGEAEVVKKYDWRDTGHAFIPADYEGRIIAAESAATNNANKIGNMEQSIENAKTKFDTGLANLDGRVAQLENNEVGIPDYWQEHIAQKIADINELHEQFGKDCFSFVVMTDMHYQSNLGRKAPLLAQKIMDECGIRYALCLGDTQTRGCWNTAEELRAENKAILQMLEPIKDRLLRTQGNHDGNYGRLDDGTTYVYRITPQELHNHIYRKVGLVGDAHFDESGSGYWIDDNVNKVRYIILNSHNTAYELNDDDTQKHSNMHIFRFGQSQYDMVVGALNTVPSSKWSIVLAAHVALGVNGGHSHWGNGIEEEADCTLMDNLLSAYKNGESSFEGTFSESGKYDYVNITADFIDPKNRGIIVGFFGGHTHLDLNTKYQYKDGETIKFSAITRVTTRCDAKEENDGTLNAERVAETTTEQSFDVFTIDTKNRRIYATKIGAGSSPDKKIAREISY